MTTKFDSTQGRTPRRGRAAPSRRPPLRGSGRSDRICDQADRRAGPGLSYATHRADSFLFDWSAAERARPVWRVIEEGIVAPQVSSTAQSRRRHALHAAFRLPDKDVGEEWGASLTDRFKQLRNAPVHFSDATSTQPMEIAWKRGVERLAPLEERFDGLRPPEDWAHYRDVRPRVASRDRRPPSATVGGRAEVGRQPAVMTILMRGRSEARRISERLVTSQDDDGLRYYRHGRLSLRATTGPHYLPTQALWGCRAEQARRERITRDELWFPDR